MQEAQDLWESQAEKDLRDQQDPEETEENEANLVHKENQVEMDRQASQDQVDLLERLVNRDRLESKV